MIIIVIIELHHIDAAAVAGRPQFSVDRTITPRWFLNVYSNVYRTIVVPIGIKQF